MICELYFDVHNLDQFGEQPACGVMTLDDGLIAKLAKVDALAQRVSEAGGLSVCFLCDLRLYSDHHVPKGAYYQGMMDRLQEEVAMPVWSKKPTDWGDPCEVDVCVAISYGDGDIVFRCHDKYGPGLIESDFIALADIQRWAKGD